MNLFLDSASDKITDYITTFNLQGATSNPTILLRDQTSVERFVSRIPEHKKYFVQLTTIDAKKMLAEARQLQQRYPEVIIKVPATSQGLAVIKDLKNLPVSVLATAIYSFEQAIIAANCGADYVAPYVNRMCNEGFDGVAVTKQIQTAFRNNHVKCQVLAASFSNIHQINQLIEFGIDAITIPLNLFERYIANETSEHAVDQFAKDWNALSSLLNSKMD